MDLEPFVRASRSRNPDDVYKYLQSIGVLKSVNGRKYTISDVRRAIHKVKEKESESRKNQAC